MPNPIQTRILSEAQDPLIARIWRAMAGLRSVVGFMNTGAHPDDETSAMLAALWLRDGVNLSYACSTRGEGGQNDIGTESGADLGTLRTAEMERAAEVLDMRLYWHGQSAEDSITDFRFSKSGTETMDIWGRARLMARFVEIIRSDRPDIICPTFLGCSRPAWPSPRDDGGRPCGDRGRRRSGLCGMRPAGLASVQDVSARMVRRGRGL